MSAWLPPGLWLLLRLRLRAARRMAWLKLKTPGGVVAGISLVLFLAFWVAQVWFKDAENHFISTDTAMSMGPLALLVFWLGHITLRGGGELLGFMADEVDQLFGAPYSGPQLLRYKLTLLVIAWTLTALFLTPMATIYAATSLGGALGAWLVLPFLQLSAMNVALVRQHTTGALARGAYVGLAVLLALAMTGVLPSVPGLDLEAIKAATAHPIGQAMLLPFSSATGIFVYHQTGQILQAAAGLALCNLALMALMLRLGRRAWLEQAAEGAEVLQQRLKSVSNGGVGQLGEVWHVTVPRLPRMGGVGPIAWRRMVELARRPAAAAALGGLVLIVLGMGVIMTRFGGLTPRNAAITLLITGAMWGAMLVPSTLRLDFRADLDRMDQLLALPLPPLVVVIGQLLPMVALVTAVEWLIIGGLTLWVPSILPLASVLALLMPTLVMVVVATENMLFLWFPVRIEAGEAALQSIGAHLLVTFGSWAVEAVVVSTAIGMGLALWWLSGSQAAGVLMALAVLTIVSALLLAATTWRFRVFDPSRVT